MRPGSMLFTRVKFRIIGHRLHSWDCDGIGEISCVASWHVVHGCGTSSEAESLWNFWIFFCTVGWSRWGTVLLTVLCCSASCYNLAALCSSVSLAILFSWDCLSCSNLAALCSSVSLAILFSWDCLSCSSLAALCCSVSLAILFSWDCLSALT